VLVHAVLALAAAMSLADVAALSDEIEDEALSLAMQEEVTSDFLMRLEDFSADAHRLSEALAATGSGGDMALALNAIAVDALVAHRSLKSADTETETSAAFDALRLALDDAIMLAPLAAGTVADAEAPDEVAAR
jgi:hypothetical protein